MRRLLFFLLGTRPCKMSVCFAILRHDEQDNEDHGQCRVARQCGNDCEECEDQHG